MPVDIGTRSWWVGGSFRAQERCWGRVTGDTVIAKPEKVEDYALPRTEKQKLFDGVSLTVAGGCRCWLTTILDRSRVSVAGELTTGMRHEFS